MRDFYDVPLSDFVTWLFNYAEESDDEIFHEVMHLMFFYLCEYSDYLRGDEDGD